MDGTFCGATFSGRVSTAGGAFSGKGAASGGALGSAAGFKGLFFLGNCWAAGVRGAKVVRGGFIWGDGLIAVFAGVGNSMAFAIGGTVGTVAVLEGSVFSMPPPMAVIMRVPSGLKAA